MKEYQEQIEAILDEAASDKKPSAEDYAELCGNVEDMAMGRRECAENDLNKNN